MSDVFEVTPEDVEERVQHFVKIAQNSMIPEYRLTKYARMLVAAEEVVLARGRDEQEVRDKSAIFAAAVHGIPESDPDKARAAYAEARKAQNEVHESAKSCALKVDHLKEILKPRFVSLHFEVAHKFPLENILSACELIKDFAAATALTKSLVNVAIAKSELSLSAPSHALVWWRYYVEWYRGKWNDMHTLACCWHLSEAKDLSEFQRRVRTLARTRDELGRIAILGCPRWARP